MHGICCRLPELCWNEFVEIQERQRRTHMKKKQVSVGIAPDDLKIGDFVAVIEPKQKPRAQIVMGRDEDGDPIMISHTRSNGDGAAGVPHKILGLSWPWIVFGVLVPGGEVDGPIIHDLRKIKCMRLDKSYVAAITAFKKPEREEVQKPEVPF
jgi:hypothetical protein